MAKLQMSPNIKRERRKVTNKQPETLLEFSCPSSHGLHQLKRMGSPHCYDHVPLHFKPGIHFGVFAGNGFSARDEEVHIGHR
jgi:hypothetical protein